MQFRKWGIRLTLLTSSLLLFDAQSIAATVAIIDQPANKAKVALLPQQFRFHFTEPVVPATVSVNVNGKPVESKFILTPTTGAANLGVSEGLRPSLGSKGQLFAPNVINVQARTLSGIAVNAATTFFVMAPVDNAAVVTKLISSTGGSLELSNYAAVEFAPNSFASSQTVSVAATATTETALDWDSTVQIFGQAFRTAYEVRVNSGAQAPTLPTVFRMVVPADFVTAGPADGEVKLFAQVLESGGEETLDSFEIFEATLTNGVLTGSLPPQIFTNRRRTDATFEAVVIVGMPRTKPTVTSSAATITSKSGAAEGAAPNSPDAVFSVHGLYRDNLCRQWPSLPAANVKGGNSGVLSTTEVSPLHSIPIASTMAWTTGRLMARPSRRWLMAWSSVLVSMLARCQRLILGRES